uniref:Uncharacterized protein n=1 Tax=Oryza sativa subsp. japonica TaxID=39947 RepID=Q6ZCZ5_ORYSJ|nr:hypothetical protein [Oryza sativa Japonica Group]
MARRRRRTTAGGDRRRGETAATGAKAAAAAEDDGARAEGGGAHGGEERKEERRSTACHMYLVRRTLQPGSDLYNCIWDDQTIQKLMTVGICRYMTEVMRDTRSISVLEFVVERTLSPGNGLHTYTLDAPVKWGVPVDLLAIIGRSHHGGNRPASRGGQKAWARELGSGLARAHIARLGSKAKRAKPKPPS